MNFAQTVAICDACWRQQQGEREPARLMEPHDDVCYACNEPTRSGIYVRRIWQPQSKSQ